MTPVVVYLIKGSYSGEPYFNSNDEFESNSENWNVAEYFDQDMAELHLQKIKKFLKKEAKRQGNTCTSVKSPYDPKHSVFPRETNYWVETAILYRHVDEFLETVVV